jgi:hypothetical protein
MRRLCLAGHERGGSIDEEKDGADQIEWEDFDDIPIDLP